MRLAMEADRRVCIRRVDQAERLPLLLVDPVLDVLDPVSVLLGEVSRMSVGDVRGGHALRKVLVHVHVQKWHFEFAECR
ncbi:MAG: hypothetical protein AUH40_02865 [Chloroflexi bacterium 13_1_40CM_65_17]|nr:MAG: hypothetical protein AUH40_02865 [Chloroflexi bacterium 13_1_40CM_65_17]